ncbi:MAG: phosphotransferase [Clostridia bacterium]|nr:phosphotransferase [Clostridia bacterium]
MKRPIQKRTLPAEVVGRARSAGAVGERWLAELDDMIAELEEQWQVTVGDALTGGSHAFAAPATGKNGEQYILKIDMPEDTGGNFAGGIEAMKAADGRGYAQLYAYAPQRKACLLERLGKPIGQLGYTVEEQIRIICGVLLDAWTIPAGDAALSTGGTGWFEEFIADSYEKLGCSCPAEVIAQAYAYLRARAAEEKPAAFVLVHGDAHNGNVLETLDGSGYRLIDPDGLLYDKAYDLGVVMREWPEEYETDPQENGRARCRLLHELTGVPEQAIWEWGYIQTVSTALVLLLTGREELGRKMLWVAEKWLGA